MKQSELTITFRAKDGKIKQHLCLSGAEMRRLRGQLKRAGRLIEEGEADGTGRSAGPGQKREDQ